MARLMWPICAIQIPFLSRYLKRPRSKGFTSPEDYLKHVKADVIFVLFGYNESFRGREGLEGFRNELAGYLKHVLERGYGGRKSPQVALVSPIAFENLSATHGTPDGTVVTANLEIYTAAMEDVAAELGIPFVSILCPLVDCNNNNNND